MNKEGPDNITSLPKSSKFTEEYLQKASYLGTILPLLDIFYETLIEKVIKKYDLNVVKEFGRVTRSAKLLSQYLKNNLSVHSLLSL